MMKQPSAPSVLAVIPARYGSTRFPGKPLALLPDGRPMIVHTWERVCDTPGVHRVVVATDDERIAAVIRQAGGEAQLTQAHHPSGTDRCWEVASHYPEMDWVVNVQGDEPGIDRDAIQAALAVLAQQPQVDIATLMTPLLVSDPAYTDPNAVKVAVSAFNDATNAVTPHYRALYFSRAPIPYVRVQPAQPMHYRHMGLYAYRRNALASFVSAPPALLEQVEQLEQLRALALGLVIGAAVVAKAPRGIDTPQDLAAWFDS
ncbi:MAG: 3-deoxy-manno-octulosonate cytidylyltransferase [Vampirovibrionales bacterium]